MSVYIDASVLLRLVLGEPNALETWQTLTPVSSELIRVECLRVIDRAAVSLRMSDEETARHRADVLEALATFRLIAVSTSILHRAADPFPTALGTLDAIHLATAITLRDELPELSLATHDRELATAARAIGLTVAGA